MRVLGIDVGSTAAKFAIVNEKYEVEKTYVKKVLGNPICCVEEIFSENPSLKKVSRICVTGCSRNIVAQHVNAELSKPEVLSHAYAVIKRIPNAKTVIEIGGQDSKLISLKDGIISNFKLNSVCGAGTGAFLESQAYRLGLDIIEFDKLSRMSSEKIVLNTKCGIFLESAIINLQRNGKKKEDIILAIYRALANNYINHFCVNTDIEEPILFQGGVAQLVGMKSVFQELLHKEIIVPDYSAFMGAIGAGYLLLDYHAYISNNKGTEIRQCTKCSNRCLVNVMKTDSHYIYSGGLCDQLFKDRID